MDREIVEGLRLGHSLTAITKSSGKGKGTVLKIRDQALEYSYIIQTDENKKIYKPGLKTLPPYPEALFPLKDGRSDKPIVTDVFLALHKEWIKERVDADWSPQTIFEELPSPVPKTSF